MCAPDQITIPASDVYLFERGGRRTFDGLCICADSNENYWKIGRQRRRFFFFIGEFGPAMPLIILSAARN